MITRASASTLTWCTMPVLGDDLELGEGALAPPQELVALPVALVLQIHAAFSGVGGPEEVGDDGVVDDQLGRGQG